LHGRGEMRNVIEMGKRGQGKTGAVLNKKTIYPRTGIKKFCPGGRRVLGPTSLSGSTGRGPVIAGRVGD